MKSKKNFLIIFIALLFLFTGNIYAMTEEEAWEAIKRDYGEEEYLKYRKSYIINECKETNENQYEITLYPDLESGYALWRDYGNNTNKKPLGCTFEANIKNINGANYYEITVKGNKESSLTTNTVTETFLLWHDGCGITNNKGDTHLSNGKSCVSCTTYFSGGIPVYHDNSAIANSSSGHVVTVASEFKSVESWLLEYPCPICSERDSSGKYSKIVCHDSSREPKCYCEETESQEEKYNKLVSELKIRQENGEIKEFFIRELEPETINYSCNNRETFAHREGVEAYEQVAKCIMQKVEIIYEEFEEESVETIFYMPVPILLVSNGTALPNIGGNIRDIDIHLIKTVDSNSQPVYFDINPLENLKTFLSKTYTDNATALKVEQMKTDIRNFYGLTIGPSVYELNGQMVVEEVSMLYDNQPINSFHSEEVIGVNKEEHTGSVNIKRTYSVLNTETGVFVWVNSEIITVNIKYYLYVVDLEIEQGSATVTNQITDKAENVVLKFKNNIIPPEGTYISLWERVNPIMGGTNLPIYVGKNDFKLIIQCLFDNQVSDVTRYVKLTNSSSNKSNGDFYIKYTENTKNVTDKDFIALKPNVKVSLKPMKEYTSFNGNTIEWFKENNSFSTASEASDSNLTLNAETNYKMKLKFSDYNESDSNTYILVSHKTKPISPIPYEGGAIKNEEALRITYVGDLRWQDEFTSSLNKYFTVTEAGGNDILKLSGNLKNPLMGYGVKLEFSTVDSVEQKAQNVEVYVKTNPNLNDLRDNTIGENKEISDYRIVKINKTDNSSTPDFAEEYKEVIMGGKWGFLYRLPPIVTYSNIARPNEVNVIFDKFNISYGSWGIVNYRDWVPSWTGKVFTYNGQRGVLNDLEEGLTY